MLADFACPVCGARAWRPLDEHVYRQGDTGLSPYEQLRRRVLFEVWFHGATEVRLRERLCTACGFCCYAPRPEPADVEAKYRFLQREEPDIGATGPGAAGEAADRRRAERTAVALRRHLASPRPSVLDFGGGDGKLLAPFVEAGSEAVLVDYNRRPQPGVRRAGETLGDLRADLRFDAAICSHVLEHLAAPADDLGQLAQHVRADGAVYVEVPLEIWKGLPIGRDPVTHLNFFTPSSLRHLAEREALDVLSLTTRMEDYGGHGRRQVIAMVCRPGGRSKAAPATDGAGEAERLLAPSPWQEIVQAARTRRLSLSGVRRRLTRRRRR